jgi:hypothetical protein
VLGDFPRYTRHFCWAPCKQVPVALEEVNELAFLFGVQAGPDLHRFARFSALMGTALVSSCVLKTLDIDGIPGLSSAMGNQRLSSLSSAMVTATAASSMLLYSQSSACRALASTVMTPIGPRNLSLR